ncbi:MAG: zf-HC2 domain-containing protein [Acidobacteria bacterium]|nr:zf-HC2 domain-containing protein [Acidobacteriota bacterium]
MNCERMETRLIAYVDGKANDTDRREVDSHLESCPECRARVSEFRSVSVLLDEMPALEISPAFDARLRQRIENEPAPGWLNWLQPVPRFALAVSMLLVMSVWVGRGPTGPVALDQQVALRGTDDDFKMINNLQLLEDYDVLSNFDALSDLPLAPVRANP